MQSTGNHCQRTFQTVIFIKVIDYYTQNSEPLRISIFNARSIGTKEKRVAISDFILENAVDIMFVTETWLETYGDEAKRVDIIPTGYCMKSVPLATSERGLAVIFRTFLAFCHCH